MGVDERSGDSAAIVDFPRPTEPRARLRRALLELNAALAAQRAAVAEFRGAIGALDGAVRGLGSSLGTLDQALARAGAAASKAPTQQHCGEAPCAGNVGEGQHLIS